MIPYKSRNTWVLGYNMGKADLTNLFFEGQKVSLEAVSITADDRKKTEVDSENLCYLNVTFFLTDILYITCTTSIICLKS